MKELKQFTSENHDLGTKKIKELAKLVGLNKLEKFSLWNNRVEKKESGYLLMH